MRQVMKGLVTSASPTEVHRSRGCRLLGTGSGAGGPEDSKKRPELHPDRIEEAAGSKYHTGSEG